MAAAAAGDKRQRSMTEWTLRTPRDENRLPAKEANEASRNHPMISGPIHPAPKRFKDGEVVTPVDTEPCDDVQDFVDRFLSIAEHPYMRGKEMMARRVAVFGQRYYWGAEVTHPLSALPKTFRDWCAQKGHTGFNSVLVNVYPTTTSNIGWHQDATEVLADGRVVSTSFAVEPHHRTRLLAVMEFKRPSAADKGKSRVDIEELRHGRTVIFDAHEHKRDGIQHRVAGHKCPRVNVTLRNVKA